MFAAILLPHIIPGQGLNALLQPDARILAATLAALTAWKSRNVPLTIATGMLALWGLQALGL